MLAYAASRPQVAGRKPSPNAMLAIIGAHVALVAIVMSAKMDLPHKIANTPLVIDLIHEDDPPPPEPMATMPKPRSTQTVVVPDQAMPLPLPDRIAIDPAPPMPDPGSIVGPTPGPGPVVDPVPMPVAVKTAARLLTPASDIRPPYPASKLASGEEALLRLRLTIDERGRVVAVEPVGPADPAFLNSARRHLLSRWRYRPASEDGRAVASTTIITLKFQLEG